MKATAMSLGSKIKELREQAGMTQDALAKRARLPTPTISHLEQDRSDNPGLRNVKKVARALGVSLDELTEDFDE